ncbi:MAG: hypothetical protein V3U84_03410 [Thiotrichaceae bacterium]
MKKQLSTFILASSICLIGLGITSVAQADSYSDIEEQASQGHSDSDHHVAHVVGIFLGGTTTDESTEFSFGAEYEYHFSKYVGVGIIAEHTPDSPHFTDGSTIALAALYIHPWRGLRLTTAIGADIGHGDEVHEVEEETGHAEVDEDGHEIEPSHHSPETEEAGSAVLVRLGVAYDFKVADSMTIAPSVNVDFVDGEENVVYGMVFSYHF